MNKIDYLFPNIKDDDYKRTITHKYNDYVSYSQIPLRYMDYDIDIKKLPTRLKTLFTNMETIVDDKLCLAFSTKDYSYTGYLSALLIDKYFRNTIESDNTLNNIIYVDTNLLMDDYKKLMDVGENTIALSHNEDTLYRNIEEASLVIWDKFSMVTSTYERQKLYNVLLSRYRKDLGNIYFIKDAKTSLAKICDEEMKNIMNFEYIVSLEEEQLKYASNNEKGNIKW